MSRVRGTGWMVGNCIPTLRYPRLGASPRRPSGPEQKDHTNRRNHSDQSIDSLCSHRSPRTWRVSGTSKIGSNMGERCMALECSLKTLPNRPQAACSQMHSSPYQTVDGYISVMMPCIPAAFARQHGCAPVRPLPVFEPSLASVKGSNYSKSVRGEILPTLNLPVV